MAGIGFALRKLARQDTLLSGLRAYSHAAVISCGPWLFIVLSLGGIQLIGHTIVPMPDLQRFSSMVRYNFCFSLVAAGPIALVVTRHLADQIYAKDVTVATSLFLGALPLLFCVQAIPGIVFFGFFVDMPPAERLIAIICLQVAGGIWVACPFLSALQSFGSICAAFAAGTLLAFACAVSAGRVFGAAGMLAGFTVGLAFIFFALSAHIFAEYPYRVRSLLISVFAATGSSPSSACSTMQDLGGQMDHVVRAGEHGHGEGIWSNPSYDSAMFLAYLTIIPTATLFLIVVETRFFEHYQRFYQDIENDATADEIDRNHLTIVRVLREGMRSIIALQVAVCYLAILSAPHLIGLAQGDPEMVPIFRFGVIGALFHGILLCTMAILSYFDLRRELLRVSAVFLLLNAGLTLVTLWLGLGYQGYGYAGAALVSLIYAYSLVSSRIARLPFMTFIVNNGELRRRHI